MKQTNFLASTPAKQKKEKWHIFVDGASRGNPGPSGAGIYILLEDVSVVEKGIFLGKRTNNQAEYLALALSLYFLAEITQKDKNDVHVTLTSDSELLIKQMKGLYKIKNPALQKLRILIDLLAAPFRCTYHHVRREKNKKADALANHGVDSRTKMPEPFLKQLRVHG